MKKHICITTALATIFSVGALAADKSAAPSPTTPPGITLIDVTKDVTSASNQFLWRRLGDANGKPLYTFDQDAETGKATCVAECAKEFVPYVAPAKAAAFGDWSIVTRDDGVKQWAYQRQPLYSYTGTDPLGEPTSNSTATLGADNPEFMQPGSKIFSPKQGWKRAAYTPEKTTAAPAEVELVSLATANGYGFVDATTKKPTYILKTAPKDPSKWTPIYTTSLSLPMGDFTVIKREDGTRQWAYKGDPLYTYTGDYSMSDTNGSAADKGAQIALAFRHFTPPGVDIRVFDGRGPLMVNKDGMAVYTQSRYRLQYGGRETRDGYRYNYSAGKAVGTRGCVGECVKTWRPLAAPANAVASGFWEVATRADGSKQWAYKGSPLYTYVGDKKPGEINGNSIHEVIYGDPEGKVDLSVTGGDVLDGKNAYGSGLYWHIAGLFY